MTALKRFTEKIASWYRIAVIAAGTLLIIALSVGIYTAYSSTARMRAVNHTHQLLSQIQLTVALLRNAESEQRGFLITGSEGYEDAAESYADQLAIALDDLDAMVSDNPRQITRARQLRDAIYERLTELRNTAQITRQSKINDIRHLLGDESEVRVMGEIRRIQSEMTAEERLLLEQRTEGMQSELRIASITILSSCLLALILGLQAFVLLRRALIGAQRETELLRQKESAETADREKSEFLANMSHEIRTPMNAVLGFAELLSGVVTTPKQRHYIDAINSSGRAMLSLINDILDLSKIEAGKLELSYQPLAIRGVLEEIQQIFSQQADARGVRLVLDIDSALPPSLLFDQTRLRQILFNVVGNALKFTETGSITVRAHGRRQERDETRLTLYLTVADTGIGIAPSDHDAIFEPFRQVDQGASRGHGGTGLGLSITKRLTELLHGRVELESTLGVGTTFRFAFPDVVISAVTPGKQEAIAREDDFNRIRPSVVLIADDVALNRDLIAGFLETSHHRVIHASTGREAIEQARRHHPDIILLDLRMPDMDGREALAVLRADSEFEGVPVISVTASSLMAEELRLREEFDGYIRKPFTRAMLHRELARLLPRFSAPDGDPAAEAVAETAGIDATGPASRDKWPALLGELRNLEAERWPALCKSMGARETGQFAQTLVEAGEAAACPLVTSYGRRLAAQVEHFQIAAMEATLREFPGLGLALAAETANSS